jgi:hypothetical protein
MTTSCRQGANRPKSRNNVAITRSATAPSLPVTGLSFQSNDVLTYKALRFKKRVL